MAVRIKVTVDIDILLAIEDAASKSPVLMKTAYKRATGRLRSRLLADLKVEPGSPVYPIRWKTQKQRRYVMAKLRREGNLPYDRTHKLANNWKVDIYGDGNGGILEARNDTPYLEFVSGIWAQPFHLDTGWQSYEKIISDYRVEAESVLIETWFAIADPTAGVKVKDE